MKEFQRMMADCRAGNIDFILVKSISRLGRNTLQFLQACNELKDLGVDVYFEVENLHINDPYAVRLLTIYAGMYQNESESKSYCIKWGFRVRFKSGDAKFYNRPCYGYKQGADGTLEIIPEEARCYFDIRLEIGRRFPAYHRKPSYGYGNKSSERWRYMGHRNRPQNLE